MSDNSIKQFFEEWKSADQQQRVPDFDELIANSDTIHPTIRVRSYQWLGIAASITLVLGLFIGKMYLSKSIVAPSEKTEIIIVIEPEQSIDPADYLDDLPSIDQWQSETDILLAEL